MKPYTYETFPKDRVPWVQHKGTTTNKTLLIIGLHDKGPSLLDIRHVHGVPHASGVYEPMRGLNWAHLLERFKWFDGSPCGTGG